MIGRTISVCGAYGRNYQNIKYLMSDWEVGKDFRIIGGGGYLNVDDVELLQNDGYTYIEFRYGTNLRKLHILKLE